MDAQCFFVDRDFELLEAFSDRLGPKLEAPEPIVWIDLPDEIRGRTGYQIVSVVRMVEEPSRRDDVTPDDQGHGRVQGLQGDRKPQVVGQAFGAGKLTKRGRN